VATEEALVIVTSVRSSTTVIGISSVGAARKSGVESDVSSTV